MSRIFLGIIFKAHTYILYYFFIQVKTPSTKPLASALVLIGRVCHQLRSSGKIDPVHPKHYNDISIAALARQIGATVITHNTEDFKLIQNAIDFDFEKP